jgi:ABC-type multidrug transport system fused ATPase/permease subunit
MRSRSSKTTSFTLCTFVCWFWCSIVDYNVSSSMFFYLNNFVCKYFFQFYIIQNYLFACSGEALTQRLRSKAFHAILRQDIAYFDHQKNNTGALCTRLATEASAVQGATGIRIGTIMQNIAALGTGIVLSFVFAWQLTLLILAFVPFMIAGGFLQSRLMTGFASKDKETFEDAGKV